MNKMRMISCPFCGSQKNTIRKKKYGQFYKHAFDSEPVCRFHVYPVCTCCHARGKVFSIDIPVSQLKTVDPIQALKTEVINSWNTRITEI